MPDKPRTLPTLQDSQALASAPDGHVWLSASAGTGKTQVLAARVFRLLLRGTDPGAILCLTFTKAGAAEMAGRISDRLAAWVRMPDIDLRKDLFALGEPHLAPGIIARARTLFAKVLDAPGGGIRIQTIHGFCQSLLSGFPVEAGLLPGFRPVEKREGEVLARQTLAALLVDAEREGRERLIAGVAALSMRLGEGGAEDFLAACGRAPAAMAALPVGIGPFLRRAFDLPEGDVPTAIAAACADDRFDVQGLRAIAAMNATWATNSGLARADAIAAWLQQSPAARAESLLALHSVWATATGTIRKFGKGSAPPVDAYPVLAEAFYDHFAALLAIEHRATYADLLAEALAVGRDYAAAYQRSKNRLGAVDFDDLISATAALLAQPGIGEWVRYKLDAATEHILVDEGQDTNERQWEIVEAIAEEFFSGSGAHDDLVRTLFVVGDFKQAIFGFQGTDPLNFARAELNFWRKATDAAGDAATEATPFNRLSLTQSFRSTRPVLEFVDAVIAGLPKPGLGVIEAVAAHGSKVPGPGAVVLWPPVIDGEGSGEAEEEDWAGDATRTLARRIAQTVASWLDPGNPMMLASKGRAVRPEDIMILVKRRGDLASLLVARLYAAAVPVAGVDRLRLNAPLAVQDLLAAIRFVLQPDDDLSLAALLVSPLIGWSQEALLVSAVPRGKNSLWRHLRATQPEVAIAPLFALLARADIATPYRLLEELLSGPLDGRRKLLERLGNEALDPIEELLSAALDFETLATPSLQAFLDWFDRGDVDIVRDPSAPLDAVRVMTVHGAKGLQAPIVILADATVDPGLAPRGILKWYPQGMTDAVPIFRPRGAERGGPLADLIDETARRELAEHWRLFYVAMTRAEERLVIAGALGPRARGVPPTASWYAAADGAMTVLGLPAGEGVERSFVGTVPERAVKEKPDTRLPLPPITLPDWAIRAAPEEARPPRPLAPSSLGPDRTVDAPPSPAMRAAAERGRLIHALFQRLPPIATDKRRTAADRWLAGTGGVADAGERATLIDDVVAVLDDARFADLFSDDALAEAPIAAVLDDATVVSGTVDRLLIGDHTVQVIDFKTGRRAPATIDDIPAYHLRQMAAYAAALAVIFPGRAVVAALLYTAGPVLFDLPPALLRAHKQRLGADQQSYDGLA